MDASLEDMRRYVEYAENNKDNAWEIIEVARGLLSEIDRVTGSMNQAKIDAIQSAVNLVRDVYEHGDRGTDFDRGFFKALDAMESMTKYMEA